MDMMELRRGVMMHMAGGGANISPWKVMKITASENYTTADTIKAWLDAEIPNSNYIFILKDSPTFNYLVIQNEFIGNEYINGTSGLFFRWRSVAIQARTSYTSTEDAIINSGDTFTIFYQ